jgi:hypothetical protein
MNFMKKQLHIEPNGIQTNTYRFEGGEYLVIEQGDSSTAAVWSTERSLPEVLEATLSLVGGPSDEDEATLRFDSSERSVYVNTDAATGIQVAQTDPESVKFFRLDYLDDSVTWAQPKTRFIDSEIEKSEVGFIGVRVSHGVLGMMLATASPDIVSDRVRLTKILTDENF